jgi:hypothetical protein
VIEGSIDENGSGPEDYVRAFGDRSFADVCGMHLRLAKEGEGSVGSCGIGKAQGFYFEPGIAVGIRRNHRIIDSVFMENICVDRIC